MSPASELVVGQKYGIYHQSKGLKKIAMKGCTVVTLGYVSPHVLYFLCNLLSIKRKL